MRDEFILGHNFKDYIQEAVSIYVASNYLSRAIIDDIKATLNELPFSGGKNFRFLLNHDFHDDPSMRKILINMLLELPNIEVRVYEGPRRFHAKVFIFESGNTFFTAIGSFNATAGGAGRNIEAGVRLTNRDLVRQTKEFFDKYWDSEHTQIAETDEDAVFVRKKFRPGDLVIETATGKQGVILAEQPELADKTRIYSVHISGKTKKVPENGLELQRISYLANELNFDLDSRKTDISNWISNYLISKAMDLTDRTLVSYATSRTETFEYQFRPLFKILQSKEHRLLIADEVGLGKTIEAGIILKELSSRAVCKRVLIIVPNALKTKWKDELQIRFDEYFDILSFRNIITFFKEFEKSPDAASIKGIITYDQLVSPKLTRYLEQATVAPPFDAIIIDEAHHLKNSETKRHKNISRVAKNAKALIMLTATPIQLMTQDLYNLLSILLPDFFFASDSKSFSAKLTVNERINDTVRYLVGGNFDAFHETIRELSKERFFKKQLENIGDFESLSNKCLSLNRSSDKKDIRKMAMAIYDFNILNAYINRTLRKDVSFKFPDRDIKTFLYDYTKEEEKIYNSILDECRVNFRNKRSAFGIIMPERRAASSLMAMNLSFKEENWKSQIEEYCDNYEVDVEEISAISDTDESGFSEYLTGIENDLKVDSKFEKLLLIINGIFEENESISDRKILIFCVFRATIHYLKKMLRKHYPDCYIDSIQGEDEIVERDNKRKRFSRNDKPAILICTEVAGEGLDFQFCHYLVNYDMPWNPSKLEQRVGRIDRIGQKAEKITVVNLVNRITIEDRIIARLFERVKLFNSTIGPLGEILSKYQTDFKSSLLSPKRNQEEKDVYEKKILENIEAKKDLQKEFEEKEMAIVGAMDNFYYENRPKSQYFSGEEIKKLWSFILLKNKVDERRIVPDESNGNIFSIAVNSEVKSLLIDMINDSPMDRFNPRKRRHYKVLVENHYHNKKPISYTFDQETALENLHVEQLTLTHPFIQGGIQKLTDHYRGKKSALFCTMSSDNTEKGNYIISIYRFTIINSKAGKREYVEEKYLCLPTGLDADLWEIGESIFHDLIKNETTKSIDAKDISETISSNQEHITSNIHSMAEKILEFYTKLSEDRLKAQKQSINEFYQDRKSKLNRDLRYIHDNTQRDSYKKEIARLDEELKCKIEDLSFSDITISIKCTGIVYVEAL